MGVESNNSDKFNHPGLRHLVGIMVGGTVVFALSAGLLVNYVGSTKPEMKRLSRVEAQYKDLRRDYDGRTKAMEQFCNRMYREWNRTEMADKELSPRDYKSRSFYDACLKRARGR